MYKINEITNKAKLKRYLPGKANQYLKCHGVNWGDHNTEF